MANTKLTKAERKRKDAFRYRYSKTAYAMLAPAIVLLLVFSTIPLAMAMIRSFQDYNTKEWVGFENYDYVLKTPSFMGSFENVLVFIVIIVSAMLILSFLFAHVLRAIPPRLSSFVKIILYIPCLISGVVTAILYMFLMNYGGGLFTSIFISLGIQPISFQTQGIWPYVCIIIPTLWGGFGYNSLVMYAGLMNVPKQYYEAADMDGAGPFRKLISITVPNMRNYFILMLVNLITGTLQMMEIPYLITGGGPLEKTLTPALYLFNSFRDAGRSQNVTIAGAILILILTVLVNVIAFRLIQSKKSEEG